jgi:hypothetical protein
VLWVIIAGIISACSSKPVINGQPKLPDGTYEVNPVFREFYAHLGGEEVLGVAISSMFENENIKYQYTENCLMEYDASRSSNQQFALAPLGSEMGISDPPITNSSLPGNRSLMDILFTRILWRFMILWEGPVSLDDRLPRYVIILNMKDLSNILQTWVFISKMAIGVTRSVYWSTEHGNVISIADT